MPRMLRMLSRRSCLSVDEPSGLRGQMGFVAQMSFLAG
jgi:hypothetical protein